jgi:ribose transport system permease protein
MPVLKIKTDLIKLNKDTVQMLLVVLALAVLMIVFSSISPYFFTLNNILTILLTATSVGLIAIGQFLCLLSGNFDMSVGNVAALSGIIYCMLVKGYGFSVPLAIGCGLVFGIFSGTVVGFCVSKLKTNAFITTFALMQIYRGVLFVLTAGMPISMPTNPAFRLIGSFKVLGRIQLPIILMLAAYLIFYFLLNYIRIGRSVYCIGGNKEAAHISGINVAGTQMFCFIIVAAFSAIAGMIFASRVNSGQVNVGATYAMESIAACVVGGTSMSGGKGSIWGVLLGVLIVNVIQNGLIMIGVDPSYQYIATGFILFIAVVIQTDRKKNG